MRAWARRDASLRLGPSRGGGALQVLKDPDRGRTAGWPWGAAIFAAALGLRLLHLTQIADSPLFDVPVVDAKTYADLARGMLGGSWRGPDGPFWQPPLYSYFLGLLWWLAGGVDWVLPRVVQAAIGAATCILVWRLGCRAFTPGIGVAAGLAAALWGPLLLFDGELLPVALAVPLDLLALLALLRAGAAATGAARGRWSLLAGAALGTAALCVANVLAFVPVAAGWLWQRRPEGGSRWPAPLLLVAGAAMAVAPATARNLAVAHELVLISTNAGVNAYIGNNPDFDRTVAIQPGPEWIELVTRARREGGAMSASAQSRWYLARAWEFARTQPLAWLHLTARKARLYLHGFELGRNQDLYAARGDSRVLAALLWRWVVAFPLGLALPLAAVGGLQGWRAGLLAAPPARLLLLYLAVYSATVIAFFPASRYRLPAVPVLLLLAALGGRELWRLRRSGARNAALPAAVALAVAVLANAGGPAAAPAAGAQTEHRLGFAFQQKGMLANAARHYRAALDLDPSLPEARYNLGAIYAEQGRFDRAAAEFAAYAQRFPDALQGRLSLGDALLRAGRVDEALAVYRDLAQAEGLAAAHGAGQVGAGPAQVWGRIAAAQASRGQLAEATAAYRTLLELRPDSTEARFVLGRVLEERDLPAAAGDEYAQVLRADEAHLAARHRLACVLFQQGRVEEAKAQLEEVIARDPAAVDSRWLLASQYTVEHRGREALAQAEAILAVQPDHQGANWLSGQLYVILGDTLLGAARIQRLKELHVEQRQAEIAEGLKQGVREMMGAGGP